MHTDTYENNIEYRRHVDRGSSTTHRRHGKDRLGPDGSRGSHRPRERPPSGRSRRDRKEPRPASPEADGPGGVILVDTSVWVDHFRRRNERFESLLRGEQVLGHMFILGELACGNLRNRREILGLLAALPQAPLAGNGEALEFLERAKLQGKGVGWIDIHLLTSARIANAPLWTLDRRLARAAESISLGF
jgi:predicted nucleic acid-binding protein